MSPQREAAIGYLRAQVAKYRAELSVWRKKAKLAGEGLAQSMIVMPLQDLIEDAAELQLQQEHVVRLETRPANIEGKGAITATDIHEKLTAAGIAIDKKKIHLHVPVKTLGKHTVKVKLHADVSVEVNFDVVSENPIEPAVVAEAPKSEGRRYDRPERK